MWLHQQECDKKLEEMKDAINSSALIFTIVPIDPANIQMQKTGAWAACQDVT